MHCVKSRQTVEATIKKSRFIGTIIPCTSEQEALHHLKKLHETYANANHIAYAYRIQTSSAVACRFHDAGEPSGTAGKPIFQHLEGKNLINLVIAVIRYFGGVKLGAGGLTRAYSNTAKTVIDAADIVDYVIFEKIRLQLAYQSVPRLEYLLAKLQGRIVERHFSEQVSVLIEVPSDNKVRLLQELRERR